MTDQPETAWQALIDDLHAEVDQGHMHVHRIVRAHRPAIEAEARASANSLSVPAMTEAARRVAACEEARASERQRVEALEDIAARLVRLGETEVDSEGQYVSLNNQLARLMDTARSLLASPTPEPRPAPLDVERLTRALVAAIPNGTKERLGKPDELARAIAREYAALTATGQETGE